MLQSYPERNKKFHIYVHIRIIVGIKDIAITNRK